MAGTWAMWHDDEHWARVLRVQCVVSVQLVWRWDRFGGSQEILHFLIISFSFKMQIFRFFFAAAAGSIKHFDYLWSKCRAHFAQNFFAFAFRRTRKITKKMKMVLWHANVLLFGIKVCRRLTVTTMVATIIKSDESKALDLPKAKTATRPRQRKRRKKRFRKRWRTMNADGLNDNSIRQFSSLLFIVCWWAHDDDDDSTEKSLTRDNCQRVY